MSIFSSVPTGKHGRSRYHFTPENKCSFDEGGIYPIFTRTVYAGDVWSMSLQNFVRSVPLLSPVMHRNDIKVDAFFVPFRLIWKSSTEWLACTSQGQLISPPKAYTEVEGYYKNLFEAGGIIDYLGFASIPYSELTGSGLSASDRKVNALPLRAYRLIYDYYFRNKQIEDDILSEDPDFYGDSDNNIGLALYPFLKIQNRPWRRDIFTACLPDPQNGSDILIPQPDLSASGTGDVSGLNIEANEYLRLHPDESYYPSAGNSLFSNSNPGNSDVLRDSNHDPLKYRSGLKVTGTGNITVDDIDVSNSPTMRQLRYAEFLEEFEEAQARGGSGVSGGFKEWLKNIWGANSSDKRLDRPEYLGGYRGPIQISEIPQTSSATLTSPQGTLAGKALSVGGRRLFKRHYFEEPGILMITMSIVPKSAYCQGDPREWLIDDCFDYPQPYFDHLGEMDVLNQELNALYGLLHPKSTFGYNVRNYFAKSIPDEIHGKLRTDLAYWHEGRIFNWNNMPGLNSDFLKVHKDDVSRIYPSSETSNKLIGQFMFDIRLRRNLSYYGLPQFGMK